MAYGSCRFLFCHFLQRDKSHKVIGNAYALPPFAAGLDRDFHFLYQQFGLFIILFKHYRCIL